MRENISEEDPPPWVDVQDKLFPRRRQGCLKKKLLDKLGMTQHVIRERYFLFLSASIASVWHIPFRNPGGQTDYGLF